MLLAGGEEMPMFDLFMVPFRALLEMTEALSAAARRELEDPEYIQAELLDLQLLYELGEIEEPEYEAGYQALSERLQVARLSGDPDRDEEEDDDDEED
jgi:hypothetical protein